MINNNYPVDSPKTYTVAYYNPEIDENTTLNQEQLKAITNPSEFKVINHGESYQSWKSLADNLSYGPMNNSNASSINGNPLITFDYGRNNFNSYQFEMLGSYYEYTNVLKIYNLSDARNYLRKLERGEIKIVDALHNYERNTSEEQAVKGSLRVDIEKIERGEINSVKYDWCGCTRNCLYEC